MPPEDFDVQQRSPYTPEGQVEASRRFTQGLGGERVRRWVAIAFGAWIVIGVVALLVVAL